METEKERLVESIKAKIEAIIKENALKDAIIEDLQLKNEQLARALIQSITLNSVPLPELSSEYPGVT